MKSERDLKRWRKQRKYYAGGTMKLRVSEEAMAAGEAAFRRVRYFFLERVGSRELNERFSRCADKLAHLFGDDYRAASRWLSQARSEFQGRRPIDVVASDGIESLESIISELVKQSE